MKLRDLGEVGWGGILRAVSWTGLVVQGCQPYKVDNLIQPFHSKIELNGVVSYRKSRDSWRYFQPLSLCG